MVPMTTPQMTLRITTTNDDEYSVRLTAEAIAAILTGWRAGAFISIHPQYAEGVGEAVLLHPAHIVAMTVPDEIPDDTPEAQGEGYAPEPGEPAGADL